MRDIWDATGIPLFKLVGIHWLWPAIASSDDTAEMEHCVEPAQEGFEWCSRQSLAGQCVSELNCISRCFPLEQRFCLELLSGWQLQRKARQQDSPPLATHQRRLRCIIHGELLRTMKRSGSTPPKRQNKRIRRTRENSTRDWCWIIKVLSGLFLPHEQTKSVCVSLTPCGHILNQIDFTLGHNCTEEIAYYFGRAKRKRLDRKTVSLESITPWEFKVVWTPPSLIAKEISDSAFLSASCLQ